MKPARSTGVVDGLVTGFCSAFPKFLGHSGDYVRLGNLKTDRTKKGGGTVQVSL